MGNSYRLHYRLGPAELFPNFASQVESAFTVSVLLWKAAALETWLMHGNSTMQKRSGTCKKPDKSSLGSLSLKSLCG